MGLMAFDMQMQMPVEIDNINLYVHTFIFQLHFQRALDTIPVTMNTPTAQILVSEHYYPMRITIVPWRSS